MLYKIYNYLYAINNIPAILLIHKASLFFFIIKLSSIVCNKS